jgi:hypothetical protein
VGRLSGSSASAPNPGPAAEQGWDRAREQLAHNLVGLRKTGRRRGWGDGRTTGAAGDPRGACSAAGRRDHPGHRAASHDPVAGDGSAPSGAPHLRAPGDRPRHRPDGQLSRCARSPLPGTRGGIGHHEGRSSQAGQANRMALVLTRSLSQAEQTLCSPAQCEVPSRDHPVASALAPGRVLRRTDRTSSGYGGAPPQCGASHLPDDGATPRTPWPGFAPSVRRHLRDTRRHAAASAASPDRASHRSLRDTPRTRPTPYRPGGP